MKTTSAEGRDRRAKQEPQADTPDSGICPYKPLETILDDMIVVTYHNPKMGLKLDVIMPRAKWERRNIGEVSHE